MNALILVDMQNDFITGSLAVDGAEDVVKRINLIIQNHRKQKDLVIATMDSHPENHSSFQKQSGPWPKHCVINTHGWQIHQSIDNKTIDYIIRKGEDANVDSYSGFFDDNKKSNGLLELIKKNQIKNVYICGLALDFCVKETILDALKLNINVYLYTLATRAVFADKTKLILKSLKEKGTILI